LLKLFFGLFNTIILEYSEIKGFFSAISLFESNLRASFFGFIIFIWIGHHGLQSVLSGVLVYPHFDRSLIKEVKVYATKERMLFQVLNIVVPKSFFRLVSQQFVDEVLYFIIKMRRKS